MKQSILLAATNLITKNGIKNTSLADIAKAVGISKGTLYYHYSSKDELIGDIADAHLSIITQSVLSCVQDVNVEHPKDEIIKSILDKISAIEGTGRVHMYLICEAITANDALRERIRISYINWRKTLKTEIEKTFSSHSSAESLSFLLLSIVDGLVIQSLLKTEKIPFEGIAEFLINHWT
ncbi:MAG: TetR/AcrR family transcriptional regulator [Peptostreptococcaceae bacterium]